MDSTFKESYLAGQQHHLESNMSKIVEFIKMLPLNELLICIYKRYCKYGEDDNIDKAIYTTCVRSIKDQAKGEDNYYPLFINRYNCINSLNPSRYGHELITKLKER